VTMTGMRRAAQARMQRVIERAKVKHAVTAPSPAPARVQPLDRGRIARWVAAQIIAYPPDRCLGCRRPIVFGAKWVELVNDNERARFHSGCAPVWRAQQETAARKAMGLAAKPQPSGACT
jgi:hypothetical protein